MVEGNCIEFWLRVKSLCPNGHLFQFKVKADEVTVNTDPFTVFSHLKLSGMTLHHLWNSILILSLDYTEKFDFMNAAYPLSIDQIDEFGFYQKVKIKVLNLQANCFYVLGNTQLPVLAEDEE